MVYEWKIPKFPVPAQTAGAEIERIIGKRGDLSLDAVLDESRDSGAVLHGCFEWNDAIAAEKFRKEQARDIIRNLTVSVVCGQATSEPVRAFVQIQSSYKPISEVVCSLDCSNEMLDSALRELKAFKAKYSTLSQLQSVISAIDHLKTNHPLIEKEATEGDEM